ncbi:protein daughter of sevenless isoform X2 [Scaptodrosophila lebanonensis]|nr:protein daughter of sevenless isoform X2 [Scaptodrosophila lebanonensis]
MFDIKTPKRTYYLAAETEADMRDWVNCICQVCHLHDTKQSNELPLSALGTDENRTQHTSSSVALSNSTNNTTTTSLHSSTGGGAAGTTSLIRRPAVIDQQPSAQTATADSVYVNTDYNNRATLLCDANLDQQHLLSAAQQQPPPSPATALYLNHSALIQAQAKAQAQVEEQQHQQQQQQQQQQAARLAVNSNGVVRKLPENLVLTQQTLAEAAAQQHSSVQASPALSTASGPYIPISECFSGSPKFLANNPTTPLNNLDPKFYETPRSHNNIGLNLTNDQSYSPKITNLSLHQLANSNASKQQRSQRSDSDSESVFTDDDEWAHPLPLRENVDRSTRPSDSSIENESFVLTYSQRFSKMPDEAGATPMTEKQQKLGTAALAAAEVGSDRTLEKLAKVLKNKNNLILDFKDNEKHLRDLPQLSDTENTSPAIAAHRHAASLIEESYDIPRSHQLPYHNLSQLLSERPATSPHNSNPIAASTPNLMAEESGGVGIARAASTAVSSPSSVRTLPRPHCYTNAAPTMMEGNVFRYDFIEQTDCPPVNRKLKPKAPIGLPETQRVTMEDKPPEEFPAKPPVSAVDYMTSKFGAAQLQQRLGGAGGAGPVQPPSVDRKCKPNAYKRGSSATMSPATRRSTGASIFMALPHETDVQSLGAASHSHETRTLPRQQHRPHPNSPGSVSVQHQRTASAAAAMTTSSTQKQQQQQAAAAQTEHKLQYFDLDVTNKPPLLNRQSMSVGNLYTGGPGGVGAGGVRLGAVDATATRTPVQSSVVYNVVDFVKTEAFKRIREERHKESSESSSTASNNNNK